MESRVRGEKCGVIMMRMPASEKDSLWGLRMRSSSTITTGGGGSWPVNTVLDLLQPTESEQRDGWTSILTFVEKNHGGVASRGVLSHLVLPVILGPRATRLHAPELTRDEHQDLGVEPATIGTLFANTSVHIQPCLSFRCDADSRWKPTSWWWCRIHTWSWGAATPTWTTQQHTQKTH